MVDASHSLVSTLCTYLAANVTGLTVIDEFPYANQALSYPSATITISSMKRTPTMPNVLSQTSPNMLHQITANEEIALWDGILQIDLWCSDKLQRKKFTDLILLAFDKKELDVSGNSNPGGLSLQMDDNLSEWARYDIDSCIPADDEAAAQRQERRQKIAVLVNCREVRQRTYYAMVTIDTVTQAADEGAPEFTDDNSDTETNTVPA